MSDRERYKSYLLHLLSDRNADEAGATGGDIFGTAASPGGEALRESFRRTLEALAANAHLQYGSRTVEGLAELVADEVAGRLDRARQFIDSQNPFRVERDLWNRCSAFDDEEFAAHWAQLRPWLEKRYTDGELSLSFYDAKLRSAAPIEYGYVRQEFLSEWDRALMRREITWELEILSRIRQQIEYTAGNRIKGFYRSDFSPVELSLHWSLEPGQWQQQKSDLLQTYAALCRKNPTIHTLLDALGRKGGTGNDKECGYEERYRSSLSRFVRASRSDIDEALRMLRSDTYRLADVLVISDFELDDFPEKTSAAISEVQSRNVRFHALQIGRGGNESALRLFDVLWEYNHRNHRIVQREKSYFTK